MRDALAALLRSAVGRVLVALRVRVVTAGAPLDELVLLRLPLLGARRLGARERAARQQRQQQGADAGAGEDEPELVVVPEGLPADARVAEGALLGGALEQGDEPVLLNMGVVCGGVGCGCVCALWSC